MASLILALFFAIIALIGAICGYVVSINLFGD